MSLKTALLDALNVLPNARTLHLYTLVASPIRDQELFVYTPNRPKVHVRHILVLLAQHSPDAPEQRAFVCAIEAFLYSIPSTSSAVLYISKVDSTGQGEIRPNPTRTLVTAFIEHYSSLKSRPAPNLWIHVFARSQNQYIFPNSAEHPNKRVLRDIQLCKWWKDVIESAARKSDPSWVRLYYLLPGYSSTEALVALNRSFSNNSIPAYPWTYSHPYHQTDVQSPSGAILDPDTEYTIAQLIPSFPDDPKARFLDEIAATTTESLDAIPQPAPTSPRPAKRIKVQNDETLTSDSSRPSHDRPPHSSSSTRKKAATSRSIPASSLKALAAVSADEFWERMAFRQECSQGAITGFFTAIFSSPTSPSFPRSLSSSSDVNTKSPSYHYEPSLPPSPPGELSPLILERIVGMLMNLDFSTTEHARRSTGVLEDGIRNLCGANSMNVTQPLLSSSSSRVLPRVGLEDGGEEPDDSQLEASVATYPSLLDEMAEQTAAGSERASFDEHVYGQLKLNNPPLPEPLTAGQGCVIGDGNGPRPNSDPPVTILQVRKKKRPAPVAVAP